MRQEMPMALFNAYLSLVKVLHLRGALDVGDLIKEIGDSIDYRRSSKFETAEDHALLEQIYNALLQLEPGLIDLRRVRSEKPPPGE